MQLEEGYIKLSDWIEREEYKGYDPYDTLNSWVPFHLLGRWGPVIAIQAQKRNPVNIRPLLGIKKEINPKAFGLFLQAYCQLYSGTGNIKYLDKARVFFTWLSEHRSAGYPGAGWGYNFPWAGPGKYLTSYVPTAVVTGFVVKGIYDYYLITGEERALDLLKEASAFIRDDLPVLEDKQGICISYTPVKQDLCFNSSLLAAEVLAKTGSLTGNKELQLLAQKAVEWVIHYQKADGRWNYSIDPVTGKEREQVDFHQGYVLQSIYEIKKVLGYTSSSWDNALHIGAEFYRRQQFLESGQSLWRIPKAWPVDIHNQSQGIITFARLKDYDASYLDFAEVIARWTITNMQSPEGFFYYRNFRHYKNKIPYMRWSQAWMFLALVQLSLTLKNK